MTNQEKRIEAIAKVIQSRIGNNYVKYGSTNVDVYDATYKGMAKHIIEADPLTKEVEKLRAEVEYLKKDLLLAGRDNNRLRKLIKV